MRHSIHVDGLGHGSNPIPSACRIGPLLVTGGVSGVDRSTGELPGSAEQQVQLMFASLEAVVASGGASRDDIAQVVIYVTDLAYRDLINTEWLRMFPAAESTPARHVLMHNLPGGMLAQCEALAYVTEPPEATHG